MKIYHVIMLAMLCSLLNPLVHSAAPISLPVISGLSNTTRLCSSPEKRRRRALEGLLKAAYDGNMAETKQYLISTGWQKGTFINPNYTLKGFTPLSAASSNGHTELVRILIIEGADVRLKPQNSGTALEQAAFNGHPNTTEILIEEDTGADQENYFASALVHAICGCAATQKQLSIINMLINAGSNIHAVVRGNTILTYAIMYNHAPIVERLLEAGINVNQQFLDGNTALITAARRASDADILDMLITAGADANTCNQNGDSALLIACITQSKPIVIEQLLKAGAHSNQSNNRGSTPLSIAIQHNNENIINLLLNRGARPSDNQNRQLSNEQKILCDQRLDAEIEWFLSLENNYKLPRELTRLVDTFVSG